MRFRRIAEAIDKNIAMTIIEANRGHDMTPEQLIRHFGTQIETAKALGLAQPTVADWVKQGWIPWPRQFHAQVITGGRLQADAVDPKKVAKTEAA